MLGVVFVDGWCEIPVAFEGPVLCCGEIDETVSVVGCYRILGSPLSLRHVLELRCVIWTITIGRIARWIFVIWNVTNGRVLWQCRNLGGPVRDVVLEKVWPMQHFVEDDSAQGQLQVGLTGPSPSHSKPGVPFQLGGGSKMSSRDGYLHAPIQMDRSPAIGSLGLKE